MKYIAWRRGCGWGVSMALALVLVALALVPRTASAFCGFYVSGSNQGLYNNATRVALMRAGTRTVLSMSNDYQGPPENFAMVVPVPIVLQRENVRTLPMDTFDHIESLTAPRLVEYWEQDPCAVAAEEERMATKGRAVPMSAMVQSAGTRDHVRIEAQFVVGEYEVVVLSADESTALETWLKENKYNIPQGAAEYLEPYIREQWKFFVARVDIAKVQKRADGTARLSPLRFHYDATEFRLPVRLGLLNAPDTQDLIVYVMSPGTRYETANYKNVFIPTNLDVADEVRTRFPAFYAALFDRTLERNGGRAVVTEYAWNAGSCDPCPVPSLDESELTLLGGDVLGPEIVPYQMVITRLHTRYSKASLTEDLVFRAAPAALGGREHVVDANGGIEHGAVVSTEGFNNFQARYAIRHAWTGEIACENPHRNVWGPPPGKSEWDAPDPTPARDLAQVKRGGVSLETLVYTPAPEVGLEGFTPPDPHRGRGRVMVIALAGVLAALTAWVLLRNRSAAR